MFARRLNLVEVLNRGQAAGGHNLGPIGIDDRHNQCLTAGLAFGAQAGETRKSGKRRAVGKHDGVEPQPLAPLLWDRPA